MLQISAHRTADFQPERPEISDRIVTAAAGQAHQPLSRVITAAMGAFPGLAAVRMSVPNPRAAGIMPAYR
jgi:hypothetical protein